MPAALVHSLRCESPKRDVFSAVFQVLAASLFLALAAQIRIPLYFTPVPLTGQTFGVMVVGACMGSRRGLFSVLAYLVEGGLGLPVFAGGSSGIAALLGPCGGYFLGFILQAYLVGWFAERQNTFQIKKTLPILLLSSFITLGLGVMWLSHFVSFASALVLGFYPFLMGDAIKSTVIALYLCRK